MDKRVVNFETGEDISPANIVISKEQYEAYKRSQMRERANESRSQKRYVNCYHESIKSASNGLKLHELGTLLKLLPYLKFKGGGLIENKGIPMTAASIGKAIGKSARTTATTLKSLIDEGLIVKEGESKGARYYVAEKYHTIGKTLKGQSFTKLYQVETRKRVENLTIQEAGLLYKMLPYFHYETYYLVSNPDANMSEGEELDHLNHETLAELIGVSETILKDGINRMVNQNILMKMVGANNVRFIVSPDIMFRTEYESEHTDTIRMQFTEQGRKNTLE